ncbi:hypothetical protein [Sulfurospirillum sp. 1612]|uniref:hypothetical protein n=1 Tax=Sulfurospirillum sp. 1612 TaxID=3094835 RepID=UPI002F929EB0
MLGITRGTLIKVVKKLFNVTGSSPLYACRAWVNFNGTGTVSIRASGNISSITDNGTGDYTANFIIAMEDANYYASTLQRGNSFASGPSYPSEFTTTSYRFRYYIGIDGEKIDRDICGCIVFR